MITKFIKNMLALLLLSIFCHSFSYSQQDAQYTQFMFNKLPQNAAYTGSTEGLSIRALYRDQWAAKHGEAITGAPKTTVFSIHSPLKKNNSAVGFFFVNDRLGLEQKNQFNLSFAYRVDLGKKIKLSIGVNTGIMWYKLDVKDAIIVNPNDNKYLNNINTVLPEFGAGIYIYHKNFYVGASVPNFIKAKLANKGDDISNAKRTSHLVIMAGGLIPIGKHFNIRPQVQYSYIASVVQKIPHTFDFNLSFLLYDRVSIGAQYHSTFGNKNNEIKLSNPDSFDIMAEFWATKQVMIGYSYDFTLSKLSSISSGTHEVILGFDLKSKKKKNYKTGCFHF